jgi:1-deoxy-D-xylulose-5-phosphate reductoisomerase
LERVTLDEVLKHPTWNMGRKITLDSATLFNKGLEVIEAARLFDFTADQIGVLIHPQSIVHSMVEYCDSSIIANLAVPDMRLPIQYALSWPDRFDLHQDKPLDLAEIAELHFEKPDVRRFPLLSLAYEAGRKGGNLPGVMNAANEAANLAFRQGKIPFLKIEDIVISAVYRAPF